MRTYAQLNEAIKANKIKVSDNSLNYLSQEDLKKYLTIAKNFLSQEAKDIINYLIVNNKTYINDLSTDDDVNALAGFYNHGMPSETSLKELWKALEELVKNDRILEVPVFQTKEEFNSIISNEKPADRIILGLDDEKNFDKVIKKYEPLVHKLIKQYYGKSTLEYDELMSAANIGLFDAMRKYGVRTNKTQADNAAIMNYTFGQYAAYIIHHYILNEIRTNSHTVRIPISQQNDEKKKTGKITKNRSISGDKKIGINNSDDGNKTLFDFIDAQEYTDTSLDKQDLEKLWKEIYDKIEEKFGKKIFDIWCSFYGINGHEQLKNKELAQKYDISNSSITYYCIKVNNFLQQDKKMYAMLTDVYELMKECLADSDKQLDWIDDEPLHIKSSAMQTSDIDLMQED